MIKVNELRIGNLFETEKKDLLECSSLMADEIGFIVVDRSKYPLQYKWQAQPIELTEKWLIKLGYENTLDCESWYKRNRKGKYHSSIYEKKGKYYSTIMHDKEIKHVHTLQNYYYFDVLTGEELTIKEEQNVQ